MARLEVEDIPFEPYEPFVKPCVSEVCSNLIIKPTHLDEFAKQEEIWLNPHEKLKTDGTDFLPLASAFTIHGDPVRKGTRVTSLQVDGRKLPSGSVDLFVRINLMIGQDGTHVNHGSAFSLLDKDGVEVVEKDIVEGACLFESVPGGSDKQYRVLFKAREDRTQINVEASQEIHSKSKMREMVEKVTEGVKKVGTKMKNGARKVRRAVKENTIQ